MKITSGLKGTTTTQTEMAKLLGISKQRVNELVKDGVIVRDEAGDVLAFPSAKAYWGLKRNMASEDVDYMEEKAKHEAARRKIAEIQLAKLDGSVYDAKTVELVQTEMLSNLRAQLLGLPSKLAPALEGKAKEEIYEAMTREIEEKLAELSEYVPEMFTEEIEPTAREDE